MLPPTTVQGFPKISMITKSPQKKSKSVEKLNRATTPIPPSTSPFPYQSLWNLHIRPFASSADTSKGKKKSSKWQAGSWCRRFRLKSPFFLIHRISTCVACRWWPYHLNCPTTLQKLYIGIASKRLRNVNLMDHKHPHTWQFPTAAIPPTILPKVLISCSPKELHFSRSRAWGTKVIPTGS